MIHFIGDGGHAKVCREVSHFNARARKGDDYWFVAIGDNRARKREAQAHSGPWATLIHPKASVSPSASIGEGTVIMAGAIVQAGASIGKHVIVNTGARIDHDCVIGDYAHIAPGVVLCGGVVVEEGAQVGCGVAVAQLARIPAWTLCKARRLELEPLG